MSALDRFTKWWTLRVLEPRDADPKVEDYNTLFLRCDHCDWRPGWYDHLPRVVHDIAMSEMGLLAWHHCHANQGHVVRLVRNGKIHATYSWRTELDEAGRDFIERHAMLGKHAPRGGAS